MLALVVDDESLIRMDAVDCVQAAGYDVIEAANADEALEIIRTKSDVDLLFTDVRMPGARNGIDLARLFLEQRPHCCVVITSGTQVDPNELPGEAVFVPKPFSPGAVSDAIAKACGLEVKRGGND